MAGTTLLTGGTGKTSTRIAKRLQSLHIPVLLASRKGGEAGSVTFNWQDSKTFANPFEATRIPIDTIYLVLPPASDVDSIKAFIDFAKEKGVNRFLLLSATDMGKTGIEPSGIEKYFDEKTTHQLLSQPHWQIHAYLDSIGVDYAVLRPSWFAGNFLYNPMIKLRDEFGSATGDGKMGIISEEDIAEAAVQLLTSKTLERVSRIVLGPELLSYDQAATIFSEVLGRQITHRKVLAEERIQVLSMVPGWTPEFASELVNLEASVARGSEEYVYNYEPPAGGLVDKFIGKTTFREFVEAHKSLWVK